MKTYADKYSLTKQQSLFLAKKKWDENVYCGMRMENRNVTFPQTQTILNGVNVGSVSLDDVQAILNMRDAWRFALSTISEPLTLAYACKINEYISRNESLEWGVLRTGSVGISGTNYSPPIPDPAEVVREMTDLMREVCPTTEKALNLFLWGARRQLFWDGNKRTSLLIANKLLISGGNGMLTIIERCMEEFNALLSEYYETGEKEVLKQFLYDHAICGMMV